MKTLSEKTLKAPEPPDLTALRGKLHNFKNLVTEGGKNVANKIKNFEIPTFKRNSTPEKFSAFDRETVKWKGEHAAYLAAQKANIPDNSDETETSEFPNNSSLQKKEYELNDHEHQKLKDSLKNISF